MVILPFFGVLNYRWATLAAGRPPVLSAPDSGRMTRDPVLSVVRYSNLLLRRERALSWLLSEETVEGGRFSNFCGARKFTGRRTRCQSLMAKSRANGVRPGPTDSQPGSEMDPDFA